jgi:glycosyltransferase involved in cell wall biosynthesis
VYLPSEGPLVSFLSENVSNVQVVVSDNMPIIHRAIFTPRGISQTLIKGVGFYSEMKAETSMHGFRSCYVNTLSCIFMLPILWLLRIRSFVHVHEIIETPYIVGSITAFISERFSDRIVCVSNSVKTNLQRYWSFIDSKCVLIHNGVKPILKLDKPERVPGRCNVFLFGRLHPNKGHWFLINAMKKISPDVLAKCKFIFMGGAVAGQESVKESLEELILECELSSYIEIVGFQADITDAMNRADICLVPSMFRDPFPTTVLEAMSAGKPIIATDGGGAKEAVLHGQTGYLVARGDEDGLANYLTKLINDEELRYELGCQGMQRQQEFFNEQTFDLNWKAFIMENDFI